MIFSELFLKKKKHLCPWPLDISTEERVYKYISSKRHDACDGRIVNWSHFLRWCLCNGHVFNQGKWRIAVIIKDEVQGHRQIARGAWQNIGQSCCWKSPAHNPSDDTGNLQQTQVINVLFQYLSPSSPAGGLPHRCWYWVFRLDWHSKCNEGCLSA